MKCEVCGKKDAEHIFHCEKCYRCYVCGTKENLCTWADGVYCSSCHDEIIEKRIEEFDGDTDYTDEIVCPWCGYVHSDSWELSHDEDTTECSDCGNDIDYVREVVISYRTSKPNKRIR